MIDRHIISSAFAACVFLLAADTSRAYMPATSSLILQAKRARTINRNNFGNKPCTSQHISSFVGSATNVNSRQSTALSVGNWWEDDLPNILGINPFEAALLFGALYKFYGPGVLYEFAREAGKLFSTYAPIVRDLSLDIFNEGKDYLEEDRDRELMRKSGVDVENMPRKTTNIIERFQAGMEVKKCIISVEHAECSIRILRSLRLIACALLLSASAYFCLFVCVFFITLNVSQIVHFSNR